MSEITIAKLSLDYSNLKKQANAVSQVLSNIKDNFKKVGEQTSELDSLGSIFSNVKGSLSGISRSIGAFEKKMVSLTDAAKGFKSAMGDSSGLVTEQQFNRLKSQVSQ